MDNFPETQNYHGFTKKINNLNSSVSIQELIACLKKPVNKISGLYGFTGELY